MFDRVDSRAQRGVDPDSAMRVRGDPEAQQMRLVGDRLQLLEAQLLRARRVGLGQDAAGGADLDDLGAIFAQAPHDFAHLVGTAAQPELRVVETGRQVAGIVAMPAGRADQISGGHDARADDVAALDRPLQRHVIEVATADVAHRGKAGAQHLRRVGYADDRPEIVGIAQPVEPVDRRIRVEMDMHVDQAGKPACPPAGRSAARRRARRRPACPRR